MTKAKNDSPITILKHDNAIKNNTMQDDNTSYKTEIYLLGLTILIISFDKFRKVRKYIIETYKRKSTPPKPCFDRIPLIL